MGNLVIVAIPEEQDRVWKISSEKVPHLTLLFLGDADSNPNVQQIMEFVQHAVDVSEHGRFYLDVDRRDVLGEDKADVIFFSKRSWNLKWIKQFRSQLLQNDAIRTAYDSTEQFPEWQPHLTLGYPTAPANEDPEDRPLYSVCFDRIAVWMGDFDGPEFRLEWPDREFDSELAVAYSAAGKSAVAELLHFGVKGMRWGQRKTEIRKDNPALTEVGTSRTATPKKVAKLDKKFEKNAASVSTWIKVHNEAANHVNSKIPEFNAKFDKKYPKEMKDGTLWNQHHPVTKEYHTAYNKMFIEGLNKAANSLGTNASGTRKVKVMTENEESITEFGWDLRTTKVAHSANDVVENDTIVFIATQNEAGVITSVKPKEDALAQTAGYGEIFIDGLMDGLGHYGIKGMRWGFRKAPPSAVAPSATSRVPHGAKRKTKVQVEGGENHPAHEDAIKVAEARAKLSKSGPAALSNKELRDVANRLQLENQVSVLTSSKGKRFVSRQLETESQRLTREGLQKGGKHVVKKAAQGAATAATVAAL